MHPKIYKMNFNQLFKQIDPEKITDNVFTLVGKDFLKNLPPGVFLKQTVIRLN